MKRDEYIEFIKSLSDRLETYCTWQDEFLKEFIYWECDRAFTCFLQYEVIHSFDELKEYFDYQQCVFKYENQCHFENISLEALRGFYEF